MGAPQLDDIERIAAVAQIGANRRGAPAAADSDLERSHLVGNHVDEFRWLLAELGARGLSGVFLRGESAVYTAVVNEAGYIPPIREGDHNGPATIRPCTAPSIVTRLALNYYIYKLVENPKTKRMEPVECWFPATSAEHALDALDHAVNLRPLRGVTHTPMPRKDGTILDGAGYDEGTGFLYLPTCDVPAVPSRPTTGQVEKAVALLRGMVDQFAWVGEHDEANYLGLLLTPLLRQVCPPPYKLGAIMARQPGSGKSLLNRILRDVHGGVFRTEMPHDDAELAKALTSILSCTTAPVVQFDNASGTLRSSRLAGLLTSAEYSDRLLGSTNNVDMVNDRLWTVTGNNLNFGGDLVRRTLWVTIDPGCPDPHRRTGFKLNLPQYVAEHRGDILHALLTLVAAWADAGMPAVERSSDDYARWSSVVRGILINAGVPGEFDHAESAQQVVGTDDEGWGEFLTVVRRVFGTGKFTTRQLVDRMATTFGNEAGQELIDALPGELHERYLRAHESAPSIARPLGKWFRNRQGRWAGDLVADECGRDAAKNVPLWTVREHGE